jgi:hypothetical protein
LGLLEQTMQRFALPGCGLGSNGQAVHLSICQVTLGPLEPPPPPTSCLSGIPDELVVNFVETCKGGFRMGSQPQLIKAFQEAVAVISLSPRQMEPR